MTKQEKIACLEDAMTHSPRKNAPEEEYYHFTDQAPRELVALYLEHYEVRDVDYQTFSCACDIVAEIYADKPTITQDDATD